MLCSFRASFSSLWEAWSRAPTGNSTAKTTQKRGKFSRHFTHSSPPIAFFTEYILYRECQAFYPVVGIMSPHPIQQESLLCPRGETLSLAREGDGGIQF